MTEFIGLDFEMEIKEHYTEASPSVPLSLVGLLGLALLAVPLASNCDFSIVQPGTAFVWVI